MKLLIASDLHGSRLYGQQVLNLADELGVDQLVLLGDLLYHGPRNPLPEGHDPKGLAELLNGWAAKIVCVRGNCDAEVDQMVLDFPCLADYALLYDGDVRLYLTHGHLAGPGNLPKLTQDASVRWVLASGHTHVKMLERRGNMLLLNPGSTSLPKDGSRSVALYDQGEIKLLDLETRQVLAAEQA
ncbi:MAG: phosphodiesterase [Coriobacteriia bacterium]|nr:phosphodiesterase [Coriobacteriia bacterium]